MLVRYIKLTPNAREPIRSTPGSAGADICSTEEHTIMPGELYKVPTGLVIEVPEGFVGMLYSRSGLGNTHGIVIRAGVGVIDSDYRGQVFVPLINTSDKPYTISVGDKVAQLVITSATMVCFQPSDELSETSRGTGGFGSTGV